jgi:hypothetical protein
MEYVEKEAYVNVIKDGLVQIVILQYVLIIVTEKEHALVVYVSVHHHIQELIVLNLIVKMIAMDMEYVKKENASVKMDTLVRVVTFMLVLQDAVQMECVKMESVFA